MKRYRIAAAVILIVLSGCSVGGQYGYDPEFASAPSAAVSRTYPSFESLVGTFLRSELGSRCGEPKLQRLLSNDYFVSYKIRGLRGCIIIGNSQWELIQIAFTQTGSNLRQVSIVADGWLASGFDYPLDSQFTRSMEPEFAEALQDLTRQLASDFGSFADRGTAR